MQHVNYFSSHAKSLISAPKFRRSHAVTYFSSQSLISAPKFRRSHHSVLIIVYSKEMFQITKIYSLDLTKKPVVPVSYPEKYAAM
jgi:hypothetical protein